MSQLVFSKKKAKALFEAHKDRTGLSLSKLSLKLGKGAGYLSSVLAENREHAASEHTIQAMAKLLKVVPAALCENDDFGNETHGRFNAVMTPEDNDLLVRIRKSTLDSFKTAIERLEGREVQICSLEEDSTSKLKRLLRDALMLL